MSQVARPTHGNMTHVPLSSGAGGVQGQGARRFGSWRGHHPGFLPAPPLCDLRRQGRGSGGRESSRRLFLCRHQSHLRTPPARPHRVLPPSHRLSLHIPLRWDPGFNLCVSGTHSSVCAPYPPPTLPPAGVGSALVPITLVLGERDDCSGLNGGPQKDMS